MKLFNDDCLKVLPTIPDNSVNLIVTSPPYNMRTRVTNGKYTTRENSKHFSKKYKNFNDALNIEDYYFFHKEVINQMLRVSKIIFYNIQIVTGSKEALFKIIGDFNKNIKDIIVWDKGTWSTIYAHRSVK
jgi:site-specific DNA-methyltransferase (adenine-specific)